MKQSFNFAAVILALNLIACAPKGFEPGFVTGLEIPMRDGVTLVGDVYLPGPDAYPVILELTPYGRGDAGINFRNEAPYWAEHGYAMLLVDARGQGDSAGEFELFLGSGEDGFDVVEWAASQQWSNGRVAMRGSSYTGTNQLYTAIEEPPHLMCITPSATGYSPTRDIPYGDGVLRFNWALTWPAALASADIAPGGDIDWDQVLEHGSPQGADEVIYGEPSRVYRYILEHPAGDSHWQPLELDAEDYAKVSVPSLAFTGWFDGTKPGTIAHYQRLVQHSPASDGHFLIVGAWEHMSAPDGGHDYRTGEPIREVQGMQLPKDAFLPGLEITREFYDWCLRGEGDFNHPPVQLYVSGSNEWQMFDAFPAGEKNAQFIYLSSQGEAQGPSGAGRLEWQPPEEKTPDRYTYNPQDPVRLGILSGQDVQMPPERKDVLTYTSAPMQAPLTLLGGIKLIIYAASDAPDTDFTAALYDLSPDGSVYRLHPKPAALMRASLREGLESLSALTPGEPTAFRYSFSPIAHTLNEGHRLRLQISSSAYPWVFPNPNLAPGEVGEPREARQIVFHDAEHASFLALPVID